MLCIMHEADPCGHLLVKGRRLDDRSLAIQAGMTEPEVGAAMADLEENGVFSRTSQGVAFSRKMVRDARKSGEQRKKAEARWGSENAQESGLGNAERDAEPHAESMPHIPEAIFQKPELEIPELETVAPPNGGLSENESRDFELAIMGNDPIEEALEAYNRMAVVSGLPRALKLTPKRRKSLAARLREVGLAQWVAAVEKVPNSQFLLGSTGWRADLDFLLHPEKLQKVLEGAYEGNRNVQRTGSNAERRLGSLLGGAKRSFDRG